MGRWVVVFALSFAACSGEINANNEQKNEGDPDAPDGGLGLGPPSDENGAPDLGAAMLGPGVTARVTAGSLNLRDGAGTAATILLVMPCGASVEVLGGPSTTPVTGWWNVRYMGTDGWASGKYLVPASQFDEAVCNPAPTMDMGGVAPMPPAVEDIFARAKLGVGFSYYWGHGSWNEAHSTLGTCTGACPDCTHTGQYGADCSGFVAKVWQVPKATPIETDTHPYSTYNFYFEDHYWTKVPRSETKPADAFVRRMNGAGHIALIESATDPFGAVWAYEARACAIGIVHNMRTFDSSYISIRRDGL